MTNDGLPTDNQPLGSPTDGSVGRASSAGEASLAPKRNRTIPNTDLSAAAEEASIDGSPNSVEETSPGLRIV